MSTATLPSPWRQAFERPRPAAAEPTWLAALRARAFSAFEAEGFPTPRHEAWLSTNLARLERAAYAPAPLASAPVGCAAIDPVLRALPQAGRLVFVDGRPAPALSSALPTGVTALSLAEALARDPEALRARLEADGPYAAHPFARLNTAFLGQMLWLRVAPGAQPAQPLIVLHVTTKDAGPLALHPRLLVDMGRDARLVLFESFVGLGGGADLTNAFTDARLEPGAGLEHVRVQREGPHAVHVALLTARLAEGARFHGLTLSLGAALARLETDVRLLGEGASADLDGLYVVDEQRSADLVTHVDHAVPRAKSRQLVKGVLDGESRGAFTGRVHVAHGAAGTDARQANHNMLLSPRAVVDTRPQLEIYADDVKCSHGATVGRLDESALFYLRSRGIGLPQAKDLLLHAFAGEVLARLPDAGARAALDGVLAGLLHEARSPGRAL